MLHNLSGILRIEFQVVYSWLICSRKATLERLCIRLYVEVMTEFPLVLEFRKRKMFEKNEYASTRTLPFAKQVEPLPGNNPLETKLARES